MNNPTREEVEQLKDSFKRVGYKHDKFKLIEVIEEYKGRAQKEVNNKTDNETMKAAK